jgi:tight adherence protein C
VSGAAIVMGAAAACAVAGVADALSAARATGARLGPAHRVVAAAIGGLGRALGPRAPRSLHSRIEAAGLDTDAAEVMAMKAGLAIPTLAAAALLAPAAPSRLAPLLLVALPAAAFLLPDLRLRRRTRRRAEAMEAELADVLELMRVAAGAGLTPRRALEETGRRHPGPLARELRRTASRAALGVPLAQALHELERRAPAEGIHALAAALARAEVHGAPLEATLQAQAARARSRAAQRTLERAARAAPRIQLVVALLLVPAVLLLVAAALLPALAGGRI